MTSQYPIADVLRRLVRHRPGVVLRSPSDSPGTPLLPLIPCGVLKTHPDAPRAFSQVVCVRHMGGTDYRILGCPPGRWRLEMMHEAGPTICRCFYLSPRVQAGHNRKAATVSACVQQHEIVNAETDADVALLFSCRWHVIPDTEVLSPPEESRVHRRKGHQARSALSISETAADKV